MTVIILFVSFIRFTSLSFIFARSRGQSFPSVFGLFELCEVSVRLYAFISNVLLAINQEEMVEGWIINAWSKGKLTKKKKVYREI